MREALFICVIFLLLISEVSADVLPFERCLDLSRTDNLEIQKSLSDFEMQKISNKIARSGYYPRGEASVEISGENHVNGDHNSYHPYYFEIIQPLFYFGENKSKIEKEKNKTFSSLYDLLEVSLNAEKDAGVSYINTSMTKRKQIHIRNLSKFIKKRYDIVHKMVEENKRDKNSLGRLKVYMSELDADYISLQYDYDLALASLCKTINKQRRNIQGVLPFEIMDSIDIDRKQIEDINKTMKDEELRDVLYSYASMFSPALNKQRYEIEASEQDIKISKAVLFPKIDAVAHFEGDSTSDDKFWHFGVRAVYRFLSPSDWHEVALKKEALKNQKLTSAIFERDRKYDLISAYRKFSSAIEQLDTITERVMPARAYLLQTAEGYVKGDATEVDFADACDSYDKAQRDRFSQLETYFASRLEFLSYLGQSIVMQTPSVEDYMAKGFGALNYTQQNLYLDYFFFLDMRKAIISNDYGLAEKHIKNYKTRFGSELYSGWQMLHFAVYWDNHDMVEIAIKSGYNVNSADFMGATPLSVAVFLNDKEMIELLLKNGANTNIHSNIEKWTPLIRAANKGSIDICKILIEHGADVNAKTRVGRTALHNAVQNGNLELVKLLIAHGADVNAKNDVGWTAEYIAQMEGYEELEEYFAGLGGRSE